MFVIWGLIFFMWEGDFGDKEKIEKNQFSKKKLIVL